EPPVRDDRARRGAGGPELRLTFRGELDRPAGGDRPVAPGRRRLPRRLRPRGRPGPTGCPGIARPSGAGERGGAVRAPARREIRAASGGGIGPMIDRLQQFESSFGPQAEQIKEQALNLAAAAKEQMALGSERVKKYIVNQPARALGIALGVGVLLGWLIKR